MNAITESTPEVSSDIFYMTKRPCPRCRQKMTEMGRVNESGFVFIWYQCSEAGCDGQWLQKYPQMFV